MTSTAEIESSAGAPPSSAASSIPPPMWPLEPVAGIVKFIICAAKTNAPATAIIGSFFSESSSFLILATDQAIAAPLAAHIAKATDGDNKASDMCIVHSSDICKKSSPEGQSHPWRETAFVAIIQNQFAGYSV